MSEYLIEYIIDRNDSKIVKYHSVKESNCVESAIQQFRNSFMLVDYHSLPMEIHKVYELRAVGQLQLIET
jgi:hypothetical protein